MKKIQLFILLMVIGCTINAQQNAADSVLYAKGDSVVNTTDIDESIGASNGLDFGYKGYQWGTSISSLPELDNFSDAQVNSDQKSASIAGLLGLDTVVVNYIYSDGVFWKVEINVELNNNNIDKQIDKFLRLEKYISEVYGNPYTTEQTVKGPARSYNNFLNVKYARSFYTSSWNVTPARIILVLNGIVQQPQTEKSILDSELSFLKLVYYNLDYVQSAEGQTQPIDLPSIYDIY